MEKREDLVPSGKNLEWFLRRNFGLNGAYYSARFENVLARMERAETEKVRDAIADKWYNAQDWEPSKDYTKEAWDAWGRALDMLDDLVAMGIINDDGIDSPYAIIVRGFCDLA